MRKANTFGRGQNFLIQESIYGTERIRIEYGASL